MTESKSNASIDDGILTQTSKCVKCGLCLSVCPTYKLDLNECRSPRGRLSLMSALSKDEISPTPALKKHLDSCLTCNACQRVCPANVEYSKALDLTKANWKNKQQSLEPFEKVPLWIKILTTKPQLATLLTYPIYAYQWSGLASVFKKLFSKTKLGNLESFMPPVSIPQKHSHEGLAGIAQAQLFTGCITSLCSQKTISDSMKLLEAWGVKTVIPKKQVCCSAIDRHAGNTLEKDKLVEKNKKVISDNLPLIYIASGCSPSLKIEGFGKDIFEICEYLLLKQPSCSLAFRPLPEKALIHVPCTLENNAKNPSAAFELLKQIPQLDIKVIEPKGQCCGASGTNMLKNQEQAENLLAKLLMTYLESYNPKYILTSNVGCYMHIYRYVMKKMNRKIEVYHPVNLLRQQLAFNP